MAAISIIVPTRDRPDSVARLARALASQEPIDGGFELIVVADGCTDATVRRLHAMPAPPDTRILEQPAAGPAMARNCGAALAASDLLLFLDDDVEPQTGLLRAHLALHASRAGAVAIGYLPPVVSHGFFGAALRGWWESMFDALREPSHRYTWRDLLSGHFSIRRAHFEAIGGFNPALRCHEDWEVGYRLIHAGYAFVFLADAAAWHHEHSDVNKALRRKFDEGVADVQLVGMHPELVTALPIGWPAHDISIARAQRLAREHPAVGDRLARVLQHLLPLYERWRLRFRWRAALERLMTYWYWRGVSAAAGTPHRIASLVAAAGTRDLAEPLVLDLAQGLPEAVRRIDAVRPRAVRLLYRSDAVGDIPDEPGAEPLRGVHLPAALARPLARAYATALARDGVLPGLLASPEIDLQQAAPHLAAAVESFRTEDRVRA